MPAQATEASKADWTASGSRKAARATPAMMIAEAMKTPQLTGWPLSSSSGGFAAGPGSSSVGEVRTGRCAVGSAEAAFGVGCWVTGSLHSVPWITFSLAALGSAGKRKCGIAPKT